MYKVRIKILYINKIIKSIILSFVVMMITFKGNNLAHSNEIIDGSSKGV